MREWNWNAMQGFKRIEGSKIRTIGLLMGNVLKADV
jgi:hypothetical protein